MKDPQVVPLSMPVKFAREMVADWMGASRAITGGWNAADWYVKNKDRILVHADTRLQVELLLSLADLRLNGKKSEGLDVSAC